MPSTARRFLVAIVPFLFAAVGSAVMADESTKELAPATHKQIRTIIPMLDGQSLSLNTFCLASDGDLLLCCSSRRSVSRTLASNRGTTDEARSKTPAGWVLVYTPEGKVRKSIPLDFVPTAINLSPQGDCFVAGNGQLCKLDASGKLVTSTATPNIQDMDAFKKRIEEGLKKQYQQRVELYAKQAKSLEDRIKAITDVAEEERTDRQKRTLRALEASKKRSAAMAEQYKKRLEGPINVDAMVKSKLRVTGLAVSQRDVFVSCSATEGYGYDVWRVDHDLKNPEAVLEGLRGCCGQMDIQCCGDNLLVAENTKFAVSTYDRDGKRIASFGGRDPKSIDGFGSCCNPMNVRCISDRSILTAESSIGNIKKYDTDGNLLAYIGKAKISGGCKHCALGYDEKRDRYYMLHEDAHHICVLVPLSEAPEFTEEELQSKEARKGLGQKLIGKWERASADQVSGSKSPLIGSRQPAQNYEFTSDGQLKVRGGIYSSRTGVRWRAIKQADNALDVAQVVNQVESYTFRIEFKSDDEAKISMLYNDRVLSSGNYRRAK